MSGGLTQGQFSEDVSFEGGGALNFEPKGSMDTAKIDDFGTGKSVTFGETGTITSVVSFDEVSPMRGKASLLITCASTGSNSDNDWIKRELEISSKYTGRLMNFRLQYQNELATGNARVIALDDVGRELINETLPNHTDVSFDTALEFSRNILIHKGISTITWGLQIINGENSKTIKIDDVILTPDVRETVETVFTKSDDTSIRLSGATAGSGAQYLKFTNVDEYLGSAISYDQSSGIFTILEDGVYSFTITDESAGAGELSIGDGTLLAKTRHDGTYYRATCSWSGYLTIGKEVNFYSTNTRGTGGQRVGYAAKVGSVNNFPALKDQKVEIPTSYARYQQAGSRGTGSEAFTVKFDDLQEISGDAFSVNNSNGTVITILKDGMLSMHSDIYSTTNGQWSFITKNATNPAANPLINERIASGIAEGIGSTATTEWTGPVKVGDIFRVSFEISPQASNANLLNIFHQETEVSVAVNNIVPQYGNEDSMIRLNTGSGHGSTNTKIRRFSSLVDNAGAAITYTQDAASGDSFLINETGHYSITWTDQNTAGSCILGLTLNSTELTTNIQDTNVAGILSMSQDNNAYAFVNVSWMGQLSQGDIIRAHDRGEANATKAQFTISKQANPSVIGIDGRPIDAYQQKSDTMIRAVGADSLGTTDTRIRGYQSNVTVDGNAIIHNYSTASGSVFEVIETGTYHIMAYDKTINGTWLGLSLNSTELTTDINLLSNPEDRLDMNYSVVSGAAISVSWSGILQKGDLVRVHTNTTLQAVSQPNAGFTMSKVGSLTRSIPLIDSTVDIPTSTLVMNTPNFRGSTDTKVIGFGNFESIAGEAFSYSNTAANGFVMTVDKDGILTLNLSISFSGGASYGFTINETAASLPIEIYDTATNFVLAYEEGTITNQLADSLSWTGKVKAGDVIRIKSQLTPTSGANDADLLKLSAFHMENKVAVALSNVEPQFEDVDSMVRLHTGNGLGSVDTKIRRFSSVATIKGGAITYTDSVTNGANFIINEDGVYSVTYNDRGGSLGDRIGVTLNSPELTTNINVINPVDRLTQTNCQDTRVVSTSWSGALSKGDIVRAHMGGYLSADGAETNFTIAKQALPSIAEVDVTPFADIISSKTLMETITYTGYTSGAGANIKLKTEKTNTSDRLIEVDNSSYTKYTFKEVCSFTATASSHLAGSGDGYALIQLYNSLGIKILESYTDSNATNEYGTNVAMQDIAQAGDYMLMRAGTGASSDTLNYNFSVTAQKEEEEYSTVYAVEDNENVFSAKINGESTPSVVSQVGDFVESITDNGVGDWTLNFKQGFFLETPVIVASASSQYRVAAAFSATKDSVRVRLHNTWTNPPTIEDNVFEIHVQRQGSDYRDLQRQIVSLKEFPRVNNQLTQHVFHDAPGSTLLSRTGGLEFNLNNMTYNGDNIIEAIDDSGNARTKFTALRDCTVHVSANMSESDSTTTQGMVVWKNGYPEGYSVIKSHSHPGNGTETGLEISGSFTLVKGEFFTVRFWESVANSATAAMLSIVAQTQELKSVGNLAGGENVFSAVINNDSVASIISQSVPFIESVTRQGPGDVDIVFKPGFFTESPAGVLNCNQSSTTIGIVYNISTNGAQSLCEISTTGSNVDSDFTVTFVRQGSDYRDVQEHIIQLDDFPRVNRTISETVTHTGFTSGPSMLFPTEASNTADQLIAVQNSSYTRYEFKKRCSFVATGAYMYSANPANSVYMTLRNSAGGAKQRSVANVVITGSDDIYSTPMAMSGEAEAGDYMFMWMDGDAINNTNNFFSVTATANELERIDNVEAAENVFGARISGTGGIYSQNTEFIESINQSSTGIYDITFVPEFFTEVPAIAVTVNDQGAPANTGWSGDYTNCTTSGVTVEIKLHQGVDANMGAISRQFDIMAIRQGDDYRNLADVVVALPESKVKWQHKTMVANQTSSGVISDLTFNNLEVGQTYRITSTWDWQNTSNKRVDIYNGSTMLGLMIQDGTSELTSEWSKIFVAGYNSLTFTKVDSNSQIQSSTFVILEELPLHEQTSQW